jgi:transcriptional regulator with XRE-family HTH domain
MPAHSAPDGESTASERLPALTYQAAGLIRGKAPDGWYFATRQRGYVKRSVPHVVTREGDPKPVDHPLPRLVVHSLEKSTRNGSSRRFAVLEPTAFRHKNLTARLQDPQKGGSGEVFAGGEESDFIHFWIDFANRLRDNVSDFLPWEMQSRLGMLSIEAATAFATLVGARRSSLGMDLDELADLTKIQADRLAEIEDGDIKATWPDLERIQNAFEQKERALTELEDDEGARAAAEFLEGFSGGDVEDLLGGSSPDLRSTAAPVVAAAFGGVLPPFAERFAALPEVKSGAAIRKLRNDLGITLTQLSELSGVNASHISHIENGAKLTPKTKALIEGGFAKWQASRGQSLG